jgi:uncharacterized coiled-coil protein SlyX
MADDIMAVDERVARLEVTVAQGFSEQNRRIATVEEKIDALNAKLDVVSESLEDKIDLVLDRVEGLAKESQAATKAMQREWRADRRLMFATLTDHGVRIEALESTRRGADDPSTR